MGITEKDGTVCWSGRVVAIKTDYNVRIMSDVWSDETYATVYAPETMGTRHTEYGPIQQTVWHTVHIGSSEFSSCYRATKIDAPSELIEEYNKHLAEIELKAQQARDEYAAKERANRIKEALERVEKGRIVEVYKGRKVKINTSGLCFWEGRDSFGNDKIGIATTNRKEMKKGKYGDRVFESYADVIFVAASNCRVVGKTEEEIAEAVQKFNEKV